MIEKVFYTFYAHMRDNYIYVQKGQNIVDEQVLGVQRTTGNSTGNHLYFEIRLEDKSTIHLLEYLFETVITNKK